MIKNEISTMTVHDANIAAFQYLATLRSSGQVTKNVNL